MNDRPPREGPDANAPGPAPPPSSPYSAGPPPPPLPPPHPSLQGGVGPLPQMPHGAPQLREMRLGELLDAAVNLYRSNWKTFMGIVAFVVVPLQMLQNYLVRDVLSTTPATSDEIATGDLVTLFLFPAIQLLFVTPFLTAAIARATSERYLGATPAVGEVYSFALKRTHSILWVTFLTAVATILGFIALIIPGIILYARLSFTNAIVIVEGTKGTKALGRSFRLAKGHFWRIFGTVFLAGVLTNIVAAVIEVPLYFIAEASDSFGWIVRGVATSIAAILTQPFAGIVIVLLYFDMRIRKEGFDLALMAQEMARQSPA